MQSKSTSLHAPPTAGDGAVEGLLHGLLAGAIMAAYLAGVSFMLRSSPAALVERLTTAFNTGAATLLVAHLALSAFYGVVWGFLYRFLLARMALPAWLWGVLYGALLWLLSTLLLPPETTFPFAYTGAAHLLFGLALGLMTTMASRKHQAVA